MLNSKKYLFALLTGSLFLMGGCSVLEGNSFLGGTPRGGAKMDSTETLLAAEGSWNLVEEEMTPHDPINLHQEAKKVVNPTDKNKKQYVPKSIVEAASGKSQESDINYRLIRMEREVASMRQDLNKLLPPLSQLIVADRTLDDAVHDVMNKEPASVHSEDAMHKEAKKKVYLAGSHGMMNKATNLAPAKNNKTNVNGIRFGRHKNKTRIVLDLSGQSSFRVDVDNNEKLLLVDLPETGWNTMAQKMIKNPIIKNYSSQPSGSGGTTLVLELNKSAKILTKESLPPNSTRGHRIYFDVAAL